METEKRQIRKEIIMELKEADKLTEEERNTEIKGSSIFGGPFATFVCC